MAVRLAMHPFRKYILSYTTISEQDWQRVLSCLERREISSNSIILEEGKICRYLYFLESGTLRFFVGKNGENVSKFFTIAPYCFTSQRSFTTGEPARQGIEALEDGVIWQMTKTDAFTLLDELKSWNVFVRKLVQEVQYYTELILEAMQNETAEERYKNMVINADPLLQRVSLKHLASYLGIAPQSLSRIRKKMMNLT